MTKCDFCEIPVHHQPQCCYTDACRRAAQLFATTLQAQNTKRTEKTYTSEDGDVSLTITELTEPKISTSLDKTHRIYISKNNRTKFFEEIFTLEKQGEDISYYFTPDYLEQICLGDTGADDKKYSQIIKLLKKEYKEYARNSTNG